MLDDAYTDAGAATAAADLRVAARLVRAGYVRGTAAVNAYYRDVDPHSPSAVAYCAIGALRRVAEDVGDPQRSRLVAAIAVLGTHVRRQAPRLAASVLRTPWRRPVGEAAWRLRCLDDTTVVIEAADVLTGHEMAAVMTEAAAHCDRDRLAKIAGRH